jgi:hypothetical protein
MKLLFLLKIYSFKKPLQSKIAFLFWDVKVFLVGKKFRSMRKEWLDDRCP